MSKLKPLSPNTSQMKRMLAKDQPLGAGFIFYRRCEETVQLIEFYIDEETGIIFRKDDNEPVIFHCQDKDETDVCYQMNAIQLQSEMNL